MPEVTVSRRNSDGSLHASIHIHCNREELDRFRSDLQQIFPLESEDENDIISVIRNLIA